MVEYTQDEARRAERIVEGLLAEERPRVDLQQGLSIIDVEHDANEFLGDLEILSAIDTNVPALHVGDKGFVPVSLSLIGLDMFRRRTSHRPFARYPSFFWREILDSFYDVLTGEDKLYEGLSTISRQEAHASFIRQAIDFLAIRIAGLRGFERDLRRASMKPTLNMLQRSGGTRISVPGCSFSVSTDTNGLRVFWSGAYYITGNYFGHPTSPTVGVLQSGSYVFGVDGGAYGNIVQWDTSAICTLPGKPSVHLNY